MASLSNMSYLTLDCKLPGMSVTSDESSTLVVYNYSSYTTHSRRVPSIMLSAFSTMGIKLGELIYFSFL